MFGDLFFITTAWDVLLCSCSLQRIPKKFLRENNIEVPKEIELRDESGKLWPVQISFWDSGYTVLTRGFSEFCRMNKLLPRDQCVLTFICSKGNLCKVIQVQAVRRGPRTWKHSWKLKAWQLVWPLSLYGRQALHQYCFPG